MGLYRRLPFSNRLYAPLVGAEMQGGRTQVTRLPYRQGKRGAGRHVQLPEYLQATQAWATLKPGPRALYIELKRRFNGSNNGQIILSYRDAANALNAHRNTIGTWFRELEERGFITKTQGAYLGPEGVGRAALWAVQELPLANGKSAPKAFLKWREIDTEAPHKNRASLSQ